MWIFRVVGWLLYRVQSPGPDDKWSTTDVSLIVPTIDCDEEALTEAIRSWVLNEPLEIIIVTVGVQAQCLNDCCARSRAEADNTAAISLPFESWHRGWARSICSDMPASASGSCAEVAARLSVRA